MNQKGQALIETVFLLAAVMVASFHFVVLGLHFQHEVLVDELLEEALICHFKKQKTCLQMFERRLREIGSELILFKNESTLKTAKYFVQIKTPYGTISTIKNELSLDLSIAE